MQDDITGTCFLVNASGKHVPYRQDPIARLAAAGAGVLVGLFGIGACVRRL